MLQQKARIYVTSYDGWRIIQLRQQALSHLEFGVAPGDAIEVLESLDNARDVTELDERVRCHRSLTLHINIL